ncbi:hypothetical protein DXX93_13370 [Thalassotalea euphylliae]|uniref:OmpR/PhoB-type domain-containing protein n=1 Tax=Thalassotalea euphylliae TaxID=1655234 RepID=A0A3E0TU05_9GAMM|nr:winged helix-turn-helix domain-containing protein [Thalassotalea euphylliae]REL27452.1 hypothetical protein DXX93_13370 [Thalassotalea euphylliae]
MKQVGEFVVDVEQGILRHKETQQEVIIEPKLFELLLLFIAQPNNLVSRQNILDKLWKGSLVTDNAINKLVANLRKALGDDVKKPRYIKTVPKRGYRLICKVVTPDDACNSEQTDCVTRSISQSISQSNSHPVSQSKERLDRLAEKPYHFAIAIVLIVLMASVFFMIYAGIGIENNESYSSKALTRTSGIESSARMHPNGKHLYYLKKRLKRRQSGSEYQLWVKDLNTSALKQVATNEHNISQIIAIVLGDAGQTTELFFLDKQQQHCGVYRAEVSSPSQTKQGLGATEKLFDCSDKRLKDIDYNAQQQTLYYAAQPKNFWPNQIYAFDIASKAHHLVSQVEPDGWGHHSLDISPDGEKLLIMSTDSDFKTQFLSINLSSGKVTEGVKFNQPVYEAIWHHDSKQVYYFGAPPVNQIMKSELNGNNASVVINTAERLSSGMSLFPDGKNIVFSTEQKNYNLRWLDAENNGVAIDNSRVNDIYPALFHQSEKHLFISERNGYRQLFLSEHRANYAEVISNFSQPYWIGYLAVSADDTHILLNARNQVYLLPIESLTDGLPITELSEQYLLYTSTEPIISLDFLSDSNAAITAVSNGNPELIVIDLDKKSIVQQKGLWSYGLTDSEHSDHYYLIEQTSNNLYRVNPKDNTLVAMNISLPIGFYHVKVDNGTLYYVLSENDKEYINIISLKNVRPKTKYLIQGFSSYDVANGKTIVSDIDSLEGDVHRTLY